MFDSNDPGQAPLRRLHGGIIGHGAVLSPNIAGDGDQPRSGDLCATQQHLHDRNHRASAKRYGMLRGQRVIEAESPKMNDPGETRTAPVIRGSP